MLNHAIYRKLAFLKNGQQVMIRSLNGEDRENLVSFFQQAPSEDIRFCKENLKDPAIIDYWRSLENSRRMLTLVGVEIPTNKIVASLNLIKGRAAAGIVGDIQQILVDRPLQGLGLGSLMLDELIKLATEEGLHWLKVEIAMDLKNIVKAFQSKGFEIMTVLDDYFRDPAGTTYDVALMMRPLVIKDEDTF